MQIGYQKSKELELSASCTVFLALVLLFVSSVIFTLLEGIRIHGLKACARLDTDTVTQSVFAEYSRPVMDRYHLFLLDASYKTGSLNIGAVEYRAAHLMQDNLAESCLPGIRNYDMYAMDLRQCSVTGYHIVTDDDGAGFYQLVTSYMKKNLTLEAAESLYHLIDQARSAKEESGDLDQKREKALNQIEETHKSRDQQSNAIKGNTNVNIVHKKLARSKNSATQQQETGEAENHNEAKVENPIEYIANWKNTGILNLIGADTSTMSNMIIDQSSSLTNRERNSGTMPQDVRDGGWYDRILFQEYLMKYFGCYTSPKEQTTLRYELEYMIIGKSSDKENLAGVATRLLAIREAANFVYLQTDQGKKAEAYTLATLIAGALANPILIKVVQEGVLAAWAFAESVSDVKSLLNGKRIPIIKTSSDWSTIVASMKKEQEFEEASDRPTGLGYEDYLRILLFMENRDLLCIRAMDRMEHNIQMVTGYENVRMDTMIDSMNFEYTVHASPLFLSLVTVSIHEPVYQWSFHTKYSYLSNE